MVAGFESVVGDMTDQMIRFVLRASNLISGKYYRNENTETG